MALPSGLYVLSPSTKNWGTFYNQNINLIDGKIGTSISGAGFNTLQVANVTNSTAANPSVTATSPSLVAVTDPDTQANFVAINGTLTQIITDLGNIVSAISSNKTVTDELKSNLNDLLSKLRVDNSNGIGILKD